MPSTVTKTVTYTNMTISSGDPNLPVLWHFTIFDHTGAPFESEQTFSTPVAAVSFTGLTAGTYTVKGGQRNAAGSEVGTLIASAPFDISPDITVQVVNMIA